ncbi:MAG TPA: class I SAM-dependent methyltransferase [Sandaracinaceae bacterium LLY-WYZ-13_1]|nr:class I SAM-dependent methyltransferase [Sandaracinaceae bacterium LLY-WYZ-13_1]
MEPAERRKHWEYVYEERAPEQVSWHQDTPDSSLALIEHAGVGTDAAILDVGGGASRLVDHLLDRGYTNVAVLDVSDQALRYARERLGDRAEDVAWIRADITDAAFEGRYDVWHDRAVFHFLTEPKERARYREVLGRAVPVGGHAIVATFALDGPERCSGLPVVRYAPEQLRDELSGDALALELVETWDEDHHTPAGKVQRFVFCRFRRTG